jgi:hypothetical protein
MSAIGILAMATEKVEVAAYLAAPRRTLMKLIAARLKPHESDNTARIPPMASPHLLTPTGIETATVVLEMIDTAGLIGIEVHHVHCPTTETVETGKTRENDSIAPVEILEAAETSSTTARSPEVLQVASEDGGGARTVMARAKPVEGGARRDIGRNGQEIEIGGEVALQKSRKTLRPQLPTPSRSVCTLEARKERLKKTEVADTEWKVLYVGPQVSRPHLLEILTKNTQRGHFRWAGASLTVQKFLTSNAIIAADFGSALSVNQICGVIGQVRTLFIRRTLIQCFLL